MPDLKKMLTLEALSEALPSWLKRATKPEYNADEIDSTLTTNQFVTATDKENWNAKGTYSKPSGGIPKSDLSSIVQTSLEKADSALQSETDPTVPSWAKQTNKPSYTQDEVADGSTYKRVTQTEKNTWNGKQNALTTTQMQAVNSGITSEKVTQISTNQTNILYSINNGVKNICDYVNPLQLNNCEIVDGEFKQTVTDSKANLNFMASAVRSDGTTYALFTSATITANGEYSYEFNFPADAVAIRIGHNGTTRDAKFDINVDHFVVGTTYVISINVLNCVQSSGVYRFNKIMICTKQLWDTIGHGFMPPALPNYDLTYLQAEDRASLAEVVDSGAKNLLDISQATFGNKNKVTFNADGSVTGNITEDARIWGWNAREFTFTLPAGTYCMHVDVIGGSNNNWGVQLRDSSNNTYGYVSPYVGTTTYFTLTTSKTLGFIGKIFDRTLYIMLCTKAAFGVSPKFVPYCRIPKVIADVYKEIAGSTTLTNTGLEYKVESNAKYRITAYAEYGGSNPLEIVICQSNGVVLGQESISPASGTTIGYVVATGYIQARTAVTITLKARFASATTNYVGMIVEKL